ncbi:hypothetical protein CBM2615_B60103 [Cupriavidus taiwanensis]|uniref:Uncharacterized protein n=1 Tax=Cupriavidus taiwanensis TaxID=164546 RepID=A0A375EE87_9BURK|nr:hypothetical protein CBM2614_B50096 [Cupriavidus taiwanensis]SOZ69770.1 hypothetical protein CBM2615_B60103 [Cupriavidus taiwanensis]SOZ72952.1 hypothetical protein CBM2613_B50099 [Cupriavidus taiwanensis]SPA09859.1 hypothetical protein CBM2625_B60015 [Cupriavidus taiwanensis]
MSQSLINFPSRMSSNANYVWARLEANASNKPESYEWHN